MRPECEIGGCPGCIYFRVDGACIIGHETDYQIRLRGERKPHYSHGMVALNRKVEEMTGLVQYLRNEVAELEAKRLKKDRF